MSSVDAPTPEEERAEEKSTEDELARWSRSLPELLPESTSHHPVLRMAALGASLIFFALGIAGWLIPVVTGVPFHVLGILTLGMAIPAVARRINAWEQRRSPKVRYALHRAQYRVLRALRQECEAPRRPPL